VDYGMGNIYSVINAVEFLGNNAILSSSANDILKADVIILPGVGSFGRAIKALKNSGLNEAISEFVLIKKRKNRFDTVSDLDHLTLSSILEI
jgi:glutamine amidotransferase